MPEDPFLKKIVQRDVSLAKARNPAERLQVLTALADDLSAQARALARVASPDELKDLARWYERVVENGALPQAETIKAKVEKTADDQEAVKTLVFRLGDTAAEAERLMGEVSAEAKPALERIVQAARTGRKKALEVEVDLLGGKTE